MHSRNACLHAFAKRLSPCIRETLVSMHSRNACLHAFGFLFDICRCLVLTVAARILYGKTRGSMRQFTVEPYRLQNPREQPTRAPPRLCCWAGAARPMRSFTAFIRDRIVPSISSAICDVQACRHKDTATQGAGGSMKKRQSTIKLPDLCSLCLCGDM